MPRTDGNHSTISKTAALAHTYGCRDCGQVTDANLVKVKDKFHFGEPLPTLAADGRDPVKEDDLRCGNCCCGDIYYAS